MASGEVDGVEQLLHAEQEANKVVAEARDARTTRLKQARKEAELEIDLFRQEREKAFEDFCTRDTGTSEEQLAKLKKETSEEVAGVKKTDAKKKDALIDFLVNKVSSVEIEAKKQ